MASQDDVSKFVMAVGVHFPPLAQGEEADVWMRSMVRVLQHMEPSVLARAADVIIETRNPKRDGKWFPTPSECIAACEAARGRIDQDQQNDRPLISQGRRDQSPWASWRCDMADTLIKTEMGKQAAEGGWIVTLWNYCREHGRLPSPEQAMAMEHASDDVPQLVTDLEAAGDGLSRMCAKWGRSFIERRQEMANYVFGKGKTVWRQ